MLPGSAGPRGRGDPAQAVPATPSKSSVWFVTLGTLGRERNSSCSLGQGQDCPLSQGPSPAGAAGCPQTRGKRSGRGLGHRSGTGCVARPGFAPRPFCRSGTSHSLLACPCFPEGPSPWNNYRGESRLEKLMPCAVENAKNRQQEAEGGT